MTELNGTPPDSEAPPSAANNLKNGLVGSPESKLKLMVAAVIVAVIVGVVAMTRKKNANEASQTEGSKVTMSEVNLEEDDVGAGAKNLEVDALITQVEAERERAAITD